MTDAIFRQCRANGIACRIILTVSPRDRPLPQDPDPLPYPQRYLPLLVPEIVGEQRPHYIGCGDLVDPLASRAGRFTWRDYKILRIFITGWRRIFRLIWTSKGAIPFISSWSFKSSPPPSYLHATSTSAINLGIGGPRILHPSAVTTIFSSIRTPPKSRQLSTSL